MASLSSLLMHLVKSKPGSNPNHPGALAAHFEGLKNNMEAHGALRVPNEKVLPGTYRKPPAIRK